MTALMRYDPGLLIGRDKLYGTPSVPSNVMFSNVFDDTGGILQLLFLHLINFRDETVMHDPLSTFVTPSGNLTRPDTLVPAINVQ